MKTKNQNIIGAVLVVLIMSLVPLVVSAFQYETGMEGYAWFSNSTSGYDFFLFWKGQLLLLLCALMAFYAAAKCLLVKEGMPDSKLEKKIHYSAGTVCGDGVRVNHFFQTYRRYGAGRL